MADEEHTGSCMAGERCRGFDPVRQQPCAEWPLCGVCLDAAERDIRALVWDYRDLEQHLPPSLGVWGDGQPRGRSNPLPLSEHVMDLQFEIHWVTTAWEDVLRDVDGLSMKADWAKRQRDGRAVQQALAIIEPRVRMLARLDPCEMWAYPGHEGVVEVPGWRAVLDLVGLHSRARSALGLTREEPELCKGVPCRNIECDLKTLYRQPGSDEVRCDSCGLRYSAEDYMMWVKLCAASAPRNVRPAA